MSNNLLDKIKHKKRTVRDLANFIKISSGNIPNYSLFLGAGASVTSGILSGANLVEQWRKEIYERLSTSAYSDHNDAINWLKQNESDWYDESNEYSSLFEKKFDLPAQRRRFVEQQVDKKLPSIGYAYLVELFDKGFFDTVFTTNFDDLINEAFYQFSSNRPLLCAHDSSIKGISITSSRPKIIKLHGDYLFDGIKSSLSETSSLEINTKDKLIEFTKEYGMIFIGYSGNDKSIMNVMNSLIKQNEYLKNGIYWCKRKGDNISQDLFKFLNNEKVYFVEIDGFDELMAELFHEISNGEKLSLGGSEKESKRDKIIKGFISDKFNLSLSCYIEEDIKKLKKLTYAQDISSLINELSDDEVSNNNLKENDFRDLLKVDRLIKNNKINEAEKELNNLISSVENLSLKKKYIQKAIEVYEISNNSSKALEYCDYLIKLDSFNYNYYLLKSSLMDESKESVIYLIELIAKFSYSVSFKNKVASAIINYIESYGECENIKLNIAKELIEESFKLEMSLSNDAWSIKSRLINLKYINNIDRDSYLKEKKNLLKEMESINPNHIQYVELYSSFFPSREDFKIDDFQEKIKFLTKIIDTSSLNKKKYIFSNICDLYLNLFDVKSKDNEEYIISMINDFFDKNKDIEDSHLISPFFILKSKYEISINKNLDKSLKYAKKSIDKQFSTENTRKIFNLLTLNNETLSNLDEFFSYFELKINRSILYYLKSDYYLLKDDYENSMLFLEKAIEKGMNYPDYIIRKSYIYLCSNENDKVISTVNNNINNIISNDTKDVLIINRELAKKRCGLEIDKVSLRNVIAHGKSKDDKSMGAYFILEQISEAEKILKKEIESDYMNYYIYKQWPVIPNDILNKYK
ncbi:SIR2 family protein [Proteus columbae]|uniref:SIR2 family protein n=1 Tax=Proteus columbae TaxID=1987580 RepID=UPI0034D3F730